MLANKDYAFPAGDEEWDVGCNNAFIKQDLEATVVPEDNVSILKKAIAAGHVDLVRQLLDSGMDVETRLGFEWTPLMCAVYLGHSDLAELLLDRGACANFSRDCYTVLMAACTATSVTEEKISKCVALLLSRNADPNVSSRSRMTCLMLAARHGHTQVINLLVSHGAELNFQDDSGHTALMLAVHYENEAAVLKLLQLGADKSIKNKVGHTAADIAKLFNHLQIFRILSSPCVTIVNGALPSKAETVFKLLNRNPERLSNSRESSTKLSDIELFLHGLNLEYLSDMMKENDITWSHLLLMEKEDLEKIGVTDPEDQKKILNAVNEIHLDKMDLSSLTQLDNTDSGSEELYNFLISLRQQCCHLTEIVQDVISNFPHSTSQVVLTWDPKKEAQAICADLVAQIGDLQKEVVCLRDLLGKMDPADYTFHPPLPSSHSSVRRRVKRFAVAVLGAGLLLLLSQARHFKAYI